MHTDSIETPQNRTPGSSTSRDTCPLPSPDGGGTSRRPVWPVLVIVGGVVASAFWVAFLAWLLIG